jgi:TolB protein
MSSRGENVTRLTDADGLDGFAAWSPDGKKIAYTHNNDARKVSRVFVMNADGTDVVKLTGKKRSSFLPTWSPNGRRIAFGRSVLCGKDRKRRCGTALFVMDRDGSDKRRITPIHEPEIMEYPDWSPDGKWIAYDRTGECCAKTGIWLVRPNGRDRHRITNNGARHPTWSPNSRKIVVDFRTEAQNSDLWILGRGGRVLRRLTRGPAFDQQPSWSGPR